MGKICVVGIGPGGREYMTLEAIHALYECDVIVGYAAYTDLIREYYADKEILSDGMKRERRRCELCIKRAEAGQKVCLISSGDAGVYGMAALLLEMLPNESDIEVGIVAGVTAALSGAARLGAPIGHDFCIISLSDLLTPWETIVRRLIAAAEGDFVIVLYNPTSRHRTEHIKRAHEILIAYIDADRPCGLVRNIGRDGESAEIFRFSELTRVETDMFTTVFIGNSKTKFIGERMVTPRGYRDE